MPATADPLFVPGLPDFAPQQPTFAGRDFPLTPVLDDFTRGSLGANWTTPWLGTAGTLTITSNRLTASGASSAGAWNPQAFGPDCEVYADLPTLPDAGTQVFLDLRRQSLNSVISDGYELRITPSTGDWRIRKLVSGANTVLLITPTFQVVAGDSIGFSAVGNTLTAWHKNAGASGWVVVGSVDDPTFPNVIGYIGLQTNSTGSPAWDNFGGGNLSPVVVLTPPPTSGLSDPILLPTGPSLYPSQQPYFPPAAGGATVTGASASTVTFTFASAGVRTVLGASSSSIVFTFTSAGVRTVLGASSSSIVFTFTSAGTRTRLGASASSLVFTFGTSGVRTRLGASAQTVSVGFTSAGVRGVVGASTHNLPFTFTTAGTHTAIGASTLPIVFNFTTTPAGVSTSPGDPNYFLIFHS